MILAAEVKSQNTKTSFGDRFFIIGTGGIFGGRRSSLVFFSVSLVFDFLGQSLRTVRQVCGFLIAALFNGGTFFRWV